MRVVMISDQETHGGAAVAASRLAAALVAHDHEVIRIVPEHDGRTYPWATVELRLTMLLRIARRITSRATWRRLGTRVASTRLQRMVKRLRPEVINLHNLHGAPGEDWSPEFAAVCAKAAPTVWTLHDMWSFTGRCAYNSGCRQFERGCGRDCPTPHEYPALEPKRIAAAWRRRSQILKERPQPVAVAPSRWLAREATAGPWPRQSVEVIPYGLPLDVYTIVDRLLARAALGIDVSEPVLLATAVDWRDPRKGGEIFAQAIARLEIRTTIIILGRGRGLRDTDWGNARVFELGYIDHERTKALAYSSADLLVHPALSDNLPNVVIESIACGTPVVALPVGGVPDMVRLGSTGWLAEESNAASLSLAIGRALSEIEGGTDLRHSCREVAVSEYGSDLQAQRYEHLFRRLLGMPAETDAKPVGWSR